MEPEVSLEPRDDLNGQSQCVCVCMYMFTGMFGGGHAKLGSGFLEGHIKGKATRVQMGQFCQRNLSGYLQLSAFLVSF